MSDTTYTIENAKSGRSSCKKCKSKIGKGDLRIGVHADNGDYKMTSWYHLPCFTLPRKLAKEGVDVDGFVTSMLIDETNDGVLDEKQEKIISAINEKRGTGGGVSGDVKAEDSSLNDPISQIKKNLERIRKAEELGEDDDKVKAESRKKKKRKTDEKDEGNTLNKNDIAMANVYGIYEKNNNDELKDILRWNKQKVTGAKKVLLQRIIDGHMNGRLGMCPTCEKGQLKLEDDNWDVVYCNGYYDEDVMARNTCFYKCSRMEAPRLKPWFTKKPTEEEEEEIKASRGGKESSKTSKKSSSSPLSELQSLAQALDDDEKWDLTSPTGLKAAAKAMVNLCTEASPHKLDLPSSSSKAVMEVGKILLQNKSSLASEFVEILADKFGFLHEKADKNKMKTEAASSICKTPSNGPLMAAFLELAELYFKEKNSNAGVTYKKVAEAVKNLSFEVTSENAKNLCKGKTKVQNIGKASADKMYEFVTTGTMAKLDEKRASL